MLTSPQHVELVELIETDYLPLFTYNLMYKETFDSRHSAKRFADKHG